MASDEAPSSPRQVKVGRLTIVGYGSFSWGLFAADTLVNMFFLQFLLDFGRVDPVVAGFVLSVPPSLTPCISSYKAYIINLLSISMLTADIITIFVLRVFSVSSLPLWSRLCFLAPVQPLL